MIETIGGFSNFSSAIVLDLSSQFSAEIILDYLEHSIGIQPPYRLLDVGCGKGVVVEHFRQRGIEAFGIDLRETSLPKKPYFQVMDARLMNFPEGSFDVVVEAYTLAHLIEIDQNPSAVKRVTAEMARVTRIEGILLSYGKKDQFLQGILVNSFRPLEPQPYCHAYQKLNVTQKIGG